MWTTINQFDLTPHIDPQGFEVFLGVNDDLPSLKFDLDDNGSLINLAEGQEVIVWDETALDVVTGLTMIPAMNLLTNEDLYSATSSPGSPWTSTGTLSGIINSNTTLLFEVDMIFNNSALGSGYFQQITQANYCKPGMAYCFSYLVKIDAPLTNANAVVNIMFLDQAQNVISGTTVTDTFSSTPSNLYQRRSITSAVAPSNAYYVQVQIGGQTTVGGTNSGTIRYGQNQNTNANTMLEPVLFAATQGVSYPTPSVGYYLPGSGAVMADQTTSRRCRIFTGYIDHLEVEYIGGNNRVWHVSCTGPGWVLESVNLLNAEYTTATYDNVIIGNFLTNNYANILAAPTSPLFNTTQPEIIQGALIDANTYVDKTLREVLNTLADTAGFLYWVDPYFHLHYVPAYWTVANATFDTDANTQDYKTIFPPRDFKLTRDLTQIKNRIKVIGAQLDQAIQQPFSGNGTTKTFTLNATPHIITSVTVGGVAQQVGVQGVATNGAGGVTALYNPNTNQLIFNTAPATGTNNILVNYTSPQPVSVQVQNLDSYAKYGNKWWDGKVNDSSLASVATAHLRGLAELSKYAYSLVTLTFKTDQFITAGQIILVTSTKDGYSAPSPFLVRKVTGRYLGAGQNEYEIEAGPYQPDVLDHFRNLHKAVNRSQGVANQLTPVSVYIISDDTGASYTESFTTTTQTSNGLYIYGQAVYGYSSFA